MCFVSIETPEGRFQAQFTSCGLSRLEFPGAEGLPPAASPQPLPPSPVPEAWITWTREALNHALAAKKPGRLPPLDLGSGTAFQRAVWSELRTVKLGTTVTYQELAGRAGRPNAARAAGGACGANPIPVLIPCHRVLAAGGKLGGFSAGLEWKRKLLRREGVLTPPRAARETETSR